MSDFIEVTAFLKNGDFIALPSGNMAVLFRVVHDDLKGETKFEYEGVAAITGSANMVKRIGS